MNFRTLRSIISLRKLLVQAVQIVIGTLLIAIAVDLFLVPNQLSTGGFSGIGTVLHYMIDIPVGTIVLILNVPLFIIALFRSGKKFFLNAIFGTILLSVFLNVLENVGPIVEDRFLACIYGGIIVGIGTALILRAEASTGGTELLTHIIHTYNEEIKTGSLIVILDTIIVAVNTIFFKQIEIGLYSAIGIYIMGKVLDIAFEGIDFAKMLLIISPKNDEISDKINKEIRRGTTKIYGMGMYQKEKRDILLCVASRGEISKIRKIIDSIDKKAFIIITNAREVFGEGFKE